MTRTKTFICIIMVLSTLPISYCGSKHSEKGKDDKAVENVEYVPEPDEKQLPLSYAELSGAWSLKYGGGAGYDMTFNMNYKSVIVLYLNSESLVFKGIVSIEDKDLIKVSIYEMKQEQRTDGLNLNSGFDKAKSSYFIFRTQITEREGRKTLVLRPLNIIIDGRNSDGYFEPLIKLRRP